MNNIFLSGASRRMVYAHEVVATCTAGLLLKGDDEVI